ncbi:MAG: glycosyltransferase family 2 protein [Thermoplasmataceae archaeon]
MVTAQEIAAIVVTFNRKNLLATCLDGLLSQTVPISRIYLVDNCSTDGTKDLLLEKGFLSNPKIEYIPLTENIGGAGGFHEGLKNAIHGKNSWFWFLDDDVSPFPDCLEKLLELREISSCIHPLVVYEDGRHHEWEQHFDPMTTAQISLKNASFKNGKSWCSMNVACFEGMLISKDIVEKIGLPDKDFFISGDDGLYGFLASQFTNVIYTNSGKLLKKIYPATHIGAFKIYYDLRNRFLLRKKIGIIVPQTKIYKVTFYIFILERAFRMVRYSWSTKNLLAAFFAIYDGLRGVTGRKRY